MNIILSIEEPLYKSYHVFGLEIKYVIQSNGGISLVAETKKKGTKINVTIDLERNEIKRITEEIKKMEWGY